jgi:hemolysin activation/secretion protein
MKRTKQYLAIAATLAFSANVHASNEFLFDIKEYKIDAVHESKEAREVLLRFTGEKKTSADVLKAREAIINFYAKKGVLVSVEIPSQDITSGVIHIRIVSAEDRARLRRVIDPNSILNAFPSLEIGQTVNPAKMSASAQLFNENRSRVASVTYIPSNDGTDVHLDLQNVRDPIAMSASLDNSGTSATGKERLTLALQKMDMPGDATASATYIASASKPNSANIAVLHYKMPLYSQYSTLEFYGARSNSNVGVVSDLFSVSGRGNIYGAKMVRYLATETVGMVQQVSLGLERRDYINNVTIPGSVASLVPSYTVKPITAGYSVQSKGIWMLSASLTHGMGGNLSLIRTGASSGYNILKANGEYSLPVTNDLALSVTGNIQHTSDLLVSGEQFGLGGVSSVRGLIERELSGDSGGRISFELRKPVSPSVMALMFVDSGRAWRNNPLLGEMTSSGASSAGVGVRAYFAGNMSASIDLAQVIRSDGTTRAGSGSLLTSVSCFF